MLATLHTYMLSLCVPCLAFVLLAKYSYGKAFYVDQLTYFASVYASSMLEHLYNAWPLV